MTQGPAPLRSRFGKTPAPALSRRRSSCSDRLPYGRGSVTSLRRLYLDGVCHARTGSLTVAAPLHPCAGFISTAFITQRPAPLRSRLGNLSSPTFSPPPSLHTRLPPYQTGAACR